VIEFQTSQRPLSSQNPNAQGYEAIYETDPIRHIDSVYRWALDLAEPRRGNELLDVACGVGRLVDIASSKGIRATGIDFAHAAISAGQQAGVRGHLIVGDGESLPFADESFDRVVNLGSLEHYQSLENGVAEMSRVLRPTGKAVILVPNAFSYLQVSYVWRKGTVYDDGQPLQRYGTRGAWQRLLESHGLRVIRTVKYHRVWPRRVSDLWWYLRRPRWALQMLLTPIVPIDAASCFVFICERGLPASLN
jgi:ubiquinone/menaquinone biosynthesis C-methylase UbiE